MYITFQEYEYGGYEALEEAVFEKHELEVRTFLDYYTVNKAELIVDTFNLKRCMGLLIELYHERENSLKDLREGLQRSRFGIKREKVLDHDVSFDTLNENSIKELEQTFNKRRLAIIRENLLTTGVLNRAV